MKKNNIFPIEQHGFRQNHSTVTQMLKFVDYVTGTLDDPQIPQVDAIYLDFEKAFDKVCHSKLLKKIFSVGIRNNFLSWIESFLSNRTQFVEIDGTCSSVEDVTSGVPQGSVLAPILFLIYISDINSCLKSCQLKTFADDNTIFAAISDQNDAQSLQIDLGSILLYSEQWQLKLSVEKCNSLSFGRRPKIDFQYELNNHKLEKKSEVKDLGFHLDKDMKFSRHCDILANSAKKRCCLIRRSFVTNSHDFLTKIFNCYVRPILEYGSPVWSPYLLKDIDTIESVQRAYTKRYPGLWDIPYKKRLKILKIDPLELRRLRSDLFESYKILKSLHPIGPDFFIRSRSHTRQEFVVKDGICDVRRHFLCNRMVPLLNNLPHHVFDAESLVIFKKSLHKYEFSNNDDVSIFFCWLKGRGLL